MKRGVNVLDDLRCAKAHLKANVTSACFVLVRMESIEKKEAKYNTNSTNRRTLPLGDDRLVLIKYTKRTN